MPSSPGTPVDPHAPGAALHALPPPPPALFAAGEAALADLDTLPRGLWLGTLILSQGDVTDRLPGVSALLAALQDPDTAAQADWPPPDLAAPLANALAALELPAFCDGKPELSELVLRSLLWHLDRIVDYQDRRNTRAQAIAKVIADFSDDWRARCGMVKELAEIFGELGDLDKNTRWDTLQGLLKTGAWQEVVRIRRLLERLPELARVIRSLGRSRASDAIVDSFAYEIEVEELASAPRANPRVTRVPELPGETRGICRSGRIARMLPAESMLLAHPRLRLIWHARHAERALLTYEDDDRMQEVQHTRLPTRQPSRRPQPERRREMGPMLICVDTSGSMQGGAEAVAKATVLEAVRTAHAQRRPCHVFAFGGSDEVVEMPVRLDSEGIARLAEFLGQSFHGGTDICAPIDRALARLNAEGWQLADLLIASDGEFGATPDKADAVREAKARLGLRVQGILIGDRETIGLLELADDILWIRDWRHYGSSGSGATSDSPVHSKSLTAMYFPGALRSPQNRSATVDGHAAATAVAQGHPIRPPAFKPR